MSDPEDSARKLNGVGADPLQRLASIKPPRDLSLGGPKPSKKVFIPNLNVTRNKNKGPNVNNSRDHKKNDKKDKKSDRNRNLRNGPNIIKSTGVFSSGLGSIERHSTRMSYGRDSESAPALQKPTIRVKDVIKIDKELEEQRIRSAVSVSHGKLNDEEVEDFKKSNDNEAPVKLPMDDIGWSKSETKPKVKVKQEVVIKTEPADYNSLEPELNVEPFPGTKKEVFEDDDVAKLLHTQDPTLILLKLPDTLPGRGGSVDDEAPRRKHNGEPGTSSNQTQEEGQQKKDTKCYLKNLEEGRIGKLRVHRSGRVTLLLGETSFEVSLGTKSAFYQEVVSVGVDDASRSANLVSLGPLQHKLSVIPDWETMFTDLPV